MGMAIIPKNVLWDFINLVIIVRNLMNNIPGKQRTSSRGKGHAPWSFAGPAFNYILAIMVGGTQPSVTDNSCFAWLLPMPS